MPPKRKNDGNEEGDVGPTGREKKKQKMAVARTIAVQSTPSVTFALPQNAEAGPSRLPVDSMKGLPSSIDVERFTEARAFEIDAMRTAMKTASASSTQRAWQILPRHLRRRAASHDVRRVPIRLREKARAEMDPVKPKAPKRIPKRGKAKRITRTETFLKRQRNKVWLETHIWHAKRMIMEDMWGYRLAVKPTEKAFRPSHRASVHGSILHDSSYYSLIELKGPEEVLQTILSSCCDPQGPSAKRYSSGASIFETHIYKHSAYPFDLIAPVTIIWKPRAFPVAEEEPARETDPEAHDSKKRKRKGKGKAQSTPTPDLAALRTVWIRSHPAVFDDVFSTLQTSASHALDAAKQNAPDGEDVELELADLRGQINSFEIMGPKSSQVIKGALTPVQAEERVVFQKFWSSLTDLQTSGSVPRNMVIGFTVYDPRLKFPPKNAKPSVDQSRHISAPGIIPSSDLAQSDIWEESIRSGLKTPRYKKKDLDERRSHNLIPGTHLSPLRQDDRIPVLLIQRSLKNLGSDGEAIHGWTLIIPAGWSMAFFSSLTFTGTRVGGQRERQTQSFEAGVGYFPRDYPFTSAYEDFAEKREDEESARWKRKPPAKRPNFEKLGTRSPWVPDWEVVLGLSVKKKRRAAAEEEVEQFVTAQREDEHEDEKAIQPWLLRGAEVERVLAKAFRHPDYRASFKEDINQLRSKRNMSLLDQTITTPEGLWKGALVLIKLTMCGRGSPKDLAVIYSIGDEEATLQLQSQTDAVGDDMELSEIEVSRPDKAIIGYITSGNFSLSRGVSFAIGAIPVAKLYELYQQARKLRPNARSPSMLVKVRDRHGDKCYTAIVNILDGGDGREVF